MTFLKKLGSILLKATQIAAGIAPFAEALLPNEAGKIQVASQDLAQIATIITQVETIGQALGQPGTAKLTGAAPLVAQVILQSSILANHKIANPTLFQQGATKIADGMADILNSLQDQVQTIDKAA